MKMIMTTMARANSERLPGKNTRMFCGKPLLEWTLLCGHLAESITDIYATVDSIELARIVEKYGTPIFQPEKSTHFGMWGGPVADGYLFSYFIKHGLKLGHRMTSLPTAPLKRPCDFDNATRAYEELIKLHGGYDLELVDQAPMGNVSISIDAGNFVIKQTVSAHKDKLLYHPGALGVQDMEWWIKKYGYADYIFEDYEKGIIKKEIDDGTADLSVIDIAKHCWVSDVVYYYQMPVWAARDIDDIYEWEYCEWAFEKYILNEGYYG